MKSAFINQLLITSTALAQTFDMANALISTYFDRGYGAGGANELTAADLEGVGLSPAHIALGVTLFQQLQAMRNSAAITVGDYDATLNQLRRDI